MVGRKSGFQSKTKALFTPKDAARTAGHNRMMMRSRGDDMGDGSKQGLVSRGKNAIKRMSLKAYEKIESYFNLAMWIMVFWLLLIWLMPIFTIQFTDLYLGVRQGPFAYQYGMFNFSLTLDVIFIICVVISVVFLIVVTFIAFLYIVQRCRGEYMAKTSGMDKRRMQMGCTEHPVFRTVWILSVWAFVLLVTTVTILSIVCQDAEQVRVATLRLKSPLKMSSQGALSYDLHTLYQVKTGQNVTADSAAGVTNWAFAVRGDGIVGVSENKTVLTKFTTSQLATLVTTGNVYLGATQLTSIAPLLTLQHAPTYRFSGSDLIFTVTNVTERVPPPVHIDDVPAAQDLFYTYGVDKAWSDRVDSVGYKMAVAYKQDAPVVGFTDEKQYMAYMAFAEGFAQADAVTYLIHVANSMHKVAVFGQKDKQLDLDALLGAADYCRTADVFAQALFFVSIFIIVVTLAISTFVRKWRKMQHRGYKPLDPRDDEDETYVYRDDPQDDDERVLYDKDGQGEDWEMKSPFVS